MNVRALAAITAVLGVAIAGGAVAAPPKPKPVCKLVTDKTGDTFAVRAQNEPPVTTYGPQEDTLDIVSADIATDAKAQTITGVIRLKKAAKNGQTSPVGNGYAVNFLFPGSTMVLALQAQYTAAGDLYEATYRDPEVSNTPSTLLATVTGVLDTAKNEIRISAPVSAFAGQSTLKPGQKIVGPDGGIEAYSGRANPPAVKQQGQPMSSRFVFADVALEGKTYTAGAPSCVPVGK